MNCLRYFMVAVFTSALSLSGELPATAEVQAGPSRKVAAVYFHRTVRCPTCQKVGAELEEVVKEKFVPELQAGQLEWRTLDFQAPENSEMAATFGILGPTFVIMELQDGKVASWKRAPKAWSLLGDREAFTQYVESEVRSVLSISATAAK